MRTSPNFNERKHAISMIVLHYTALPTTEESLDRLCDKTNAAGRVSAHYLVGLNGEIFQLVDEGKRAWHAGLGSWRGFDDINSRSVGIEVQNIGIDEAGRRVPYPDTQIESVISLCKAIKRRYGIKDINIIGHSDVAPTRKQDPGEAFPWKRLADAGVGIWTDEFEDSEDNLVKVLSDIGYDVHDPEKAVVAFQRHFYPKGLGENDGMTLKRAAAVRRRLREVMH